ncbi:uncharacterized protein FTOL_01736 [Fusarium torulosum]|uniref:2EXR domain-containing protein n=1 Tax=Fusarium torulosum TaxID=33205 RepID=A0AAE8M151_9HYPO|nr:uncharacterized protein FTOL_01736 [Fusarium torulosum]
MSSDTFPQFPSLPKEIQLLIWEAAVRPPDRHVHRFFIADYHLKRPSPLYPIKENFLHLLQTKAPAYRCVNPSSGFSLAVPTDDIDGNRNDSVYLSDSSLWTFSKESRQAMEKRFRKNEWWSNFKSPYHPKRRAAPGDYLGQVGASHTASYQDDNGVVKHITIDFDKDLIHLDPRYLKNSDWFHLRQDCHLPLFDYRTTLRPEAKPSFIGDNVALDYDHSILDSFHERKVHYRKKELGMSVGDFNDMLSMLHGCAKRTIWFIDYGLSYQTTTEDVSEKGEEATRRTRADRGSQPVRETFRSDDLIYTEVRREDIGPVWLPSNDEVNNSESSTAFDMFDFLVQQDRFDIEDFDRLRVLACQPLPGRLTQPRRPWAKRCPKDSTCEVCGVKEPAPRVRPSTMKREGSDSSTDISMSDLNLFD